MLGGTRGAGLRAGTYAPVEGRGGEGRGGEGRGGEGHMYHTWRMHVHVSRWIGLSSQLE